MNLEITPVLDLLLYDTMMVNKKKTNLGCKHSPLIQSGWDIITALNPEEALMSTVFEYVFRNEI